MTKEKCKPDGFGGSRLICILLVKFMLLLTNIGKAFGNLPDLGMSERLKSFLLEKLVEIKAMSGKLTSKHMT